MTDPSDIKAAREHRRLVDRLLSDAIPGAASFAGLLPAIEGAGPTDVVLSLRRLRQHGSLQAAADALIVDASHQADQLPEIKQPVTLPLPHPLDSEWRFAPGSVDELVSRLLETMSAGDELRQLVRLLARAAAAEYVRGHAADEAALPIRSGETRR